MQNKLLSESLDWFGFHSWLELKALGFKLGFGFISMFKSFVSVELDLT